MYIRRKFYYNRRLLDCDCRYASREELSEAICNKYHVADDKSNGKNIPDAVFV